MMNLKTEEIKVIAELPYSWEKIKDKTILVSGGTGFIGTAFVDVIKYRNQKYNENIKVISFSRRGGESSEYLECIKANVKALRTNDTWYGMTYKEDVAAVKESFSKMLENGTYKGDLFSDL